MSRALVLLCVSAIVTTTIVYTTRPRVAAGSHDMLSPVHRVIDVGRVRWAKSVTGTFQLVNRSKNPIVIKHAAGSCDCTSVEYPNNPIAPSATAEIRFVWDTRGRVGPTATPLVVYYNQLQRSGAPVIETTALMISGDVQPDYFLDPSKVVFDQHQSSVTTINLKRRSEVNVVVTGYECRHPAFSVQIEKDSLRLSYDCSKLDDVSSDFSMTVFTDSTIVPQVSIPIVISTSDDNRVMAN